MPTLQHLAQGIKKRDFPNASLCFGILFFASATFGKTDRLADVDSAALKVNISINVKGQYFPTPETSVQHQHSGHAETVPDHLMNKRYFPIFKAAVRALSAAWRFSRQRGI